MPRFKTSLLLLLLLSLGNIALAQTTVHLSVKNGDDGTAAAFIYVHELVGNTDNIAHTVLTDKDGHASLSLSSFPTQLLIKGLNFEPLPFTIEQAPEKELTLLLKPSFANIEEYVVTGVTKPAHIRDALAKYKVITAATLQAQGANNVQDALAYQLNTNVATDPVLGSNLRMQGFGGDKVKILIDGMPLNGRENGNIDLGQLNTYNTEKIEIIQGPMSVVYGTDAIGGVINIITKNNTKPLELNANAYYETVGKYNFNISGSKSFKRHHLTLGGGRNYFSGQGYTDTTMPHRQMLFKPKEQYLANLNYTYTAASGFKARLASDYSWEKLTNRGPAFISPYEGYCSDEYYRTTRSTNRLVLSGNLMGGQWQMLNGFGMYHRTKNKLRKDLVSLQEIQTAPSEDHDTTTFNELTFRGSYDNKWGKVDYTIGYDHNLQSAKSKKLPSGLTNLNDYAVYANLSRKLFENKLTAQLGLRAAYNTVYSAPLIPSVNFLYRGGSKLQVRASYARGFRAPSLKELYLDFQDVNHKVFGNPRLNAEKGHHFQLSASWTAIEKKKNYLQLIVTGYYNDVNDLIALAKKYPDSASNIEYDYTNILHQRNIIANIELQGQWQNIGYALGYAYAYTLADDYNTGFNAQELTATIQYQWKRTGLHFSVFNKLVGNQPFLVTNIDGTTSYGAKQSAYNMMDASVGRKFWNKKIQLTVGLKNMFNVTSIAGQNAVPSNGAHATNGGAGFLPRSFFTSLGLSLN